MYPGFPLLKLDNQALKPLQKTTFWHSQGCTLITHLCNYKFNHVNECNSFSDYYGSKSLATTRMELNNPIC